MLRDMKEIEGYTIQALDGNVGKVHSFYFDDLSGVVRYLVVNTGGWLTGRQVLISPEALEAPNWATKTFPVNLSKEQIENSPSIGTDQPVSRQMETHLSDYYGWTPYWQMTTVPSPWQSMGPVMPETNDKEPQQQAGQMVATKNPDPHLRSSREVIGYHIQAVDGEIGHVETFLVDDANWRIHYLVIDTRNWLPGKKVLIAPEWIENIVWSDRKVHVDLEKAQIETSPEYDNSVPLSRVFERTLYKHYGRPGYW